MYWSNKNMFMRDDNFPLQIVNLHDFKLCHLHYQSTIFVILAHNVFLHYLSTVLPFPCIFLVSYHFSFLCCSGHIPIEKKNHEKGRRGDWNFSAVMIKHTPFSCQEREETLHSILLRFQQRTLPGSERLKHECPTSH